MFSDCPRCGSDEHGYCAPVCHYCSAPATVESATGLPGDFDDARRYIAPIAEPRCEECHAGFINAAKRERRLAEEGWV